MKKEISIGNENFKDLISNNRYYVDKTQMIEDIIKCGNKAILFPRPRRFGKTLTMSMLENFFSIELAEENKDLFKDLYIESSLYYNLRGTIPVIRLSLKDIQADNFESFYNLFQILVSNIYKSKSDIYENLSEVDKKDFDAIIFKTGTPEEFQMAIPNLMSYLKKVYKKNVLLLIDEYDAPIQRAYNLTENLDDETGYYKKVINFLKTVFSSSAKDNNDLYMAIFTGVLRVSQESIFSDLNNFEVYGLLDSPFKEYFGFNESETKELLEYYDLELTNDVKNMYDGYNFNGVNVYNPWSILKYASWKKLNPYWVNTSSNGLIKEMLINCQANVKRIIEKLIQGESTIFIYNEKLTYKDLRNNNDLNALLNMLFASGYLTYSETKLINNVEATFVKIPNREVNKLITGIMEETVNPNNNKMFAFDMLDSIVNYDLIKMENILNENLYSLSYMDNKEFMYHLYTLGFVSCCLNNDDYIVKSNREAGLGRSDVMIERVDRTFGYVFEFKVTDDEDMESVAKDALEQIENKEYYKELEHDKIKDIRKVSIVFNNKKCIVR